MITDPLPVLQRAGHRLDAGIQRRIVLRIARTTRVGPLVIEAAHLGSEDGRQRLDLYVSAADAFAAHPRQEVILTGDMNTELP